MKCFVFIAINIQATPPTCEAAGDGTLLTPPSSPLPAEERPSSSRPSPPNSSYDPGMKCVRQVEDDEAEAIALALNKSIQAPERVIPDQLVPIDDLTLVHIQPGVSFNVVNDLFETFCQEIEKRRTVDSINNINLNNSAKIM